LLFNSYLTWKLLYNICKICIYLLFYIVIGIVLVLFGFTIVVIYRFFSRYSSIILLWPTYLYNKIKNFVFFLMFYFFQLIHITYYFCYSFMQNLYYTLSWIFLENWTNKQFWLLILTFFKFIWIYNKNRIYNYIEILICCAILGANIWLVYICYLLLYDLYLKYFSAVKEIFSFKNLKKVIKIIFSYKTFKRIIILLFFYYQLQSFFNSFWYLRIVDDVISYCHFICIISNLAVDTDLFYFVSFTNYIKIVLCYIIAPVLRYLIYYRLIPYIMKYLILSWNVYFVYSLYNRILAIWQRLGLYFEFVYVYKKIFFLRIFRLFWKLLVIMVMNCLIKLGLSFFFFVDNFYARVLLYLLWQWPIPIIY
jgi:hypothetical protein